MKKLVFLFLLLQIKLFAQTTLKQSFINPPNSAKPRVWWHWMNGNISKDGIQKDLEWFEKTGIGGFQNFDANLFTPVVVPKKLVFMDPAWKDAFKFTAELADKKGLEMAIAGSPGWSVTGGPWVQPKDAMKKYVWTEVLLEGGKTHTIKLPELPNVVGKFQDVAISDGVTGGFEGEKPHYSQDAYVIAYKLPSNEKHILDLNPKITKSGGDWDGKVMLDHNMANAYFLPPMEVGQDMYVQYEFPMAQTFKAFGLGISAAGGMAEFRGVPKNRRLKVSDDGVNFRTIAELTTSINPFLTNAIPATTAKYWRMCFETIPGSPNFMAAMAGGVPSPAKPDGAYISEFVLFNTSRIDQAEDKAGFTPWKEDNPMTLSDTADTISENDIIDISDKMSAEGTLTWNAPAGNWMVVRFGASLTGRQNHPASPEATGLEVDKLDKDAVRRYINTYLDMYKDATGGLMGAKGLKYMVLDSYEAGHMTWTSALPQEFKNRRGYDLVKWIPALTGRIVNSSEASEKFLWDFRRTIGELIAENHYDIIGDELHKRGMKRYTESHEDRRIYLADGMDVKRHSDIPMAAMWTPGSLADGSNEEVRSEADIREAASVANIYGQNIVAAESMTSIQNAFSWHPEKLKRTADLEMASGLNRFVIHTSVHQPLDIAPGFSLGPFGQYFSRLESWSGAGAKAWIGYLGRTSHMLQQGKNVADILYLYGENTNITWLCRKNLPNIPAGFEFDFVNSNALINAISVKNGKLMAKSGNTYSHLIIGETAKTMTLPVLKKLNELVKAGAKVSGYKPLLSPSLSDNPEEFNKIAAELWASKNIMAGPTAKPDVIITGNSSKILFRHRKSDVDIYWLNNRSDNPTTAEVSFRITGKIPELWNAETGKTEKLTYQIKEGRTIVPLKFESWDAYFVVFKEKATSNSFMKADKPTVIAAEISEPWSVNIAGKTLSLNSLSDWSKNVDSDIKYFSGTAIYKNKLNINMPKGTQILNIAEVKNIAEVIINGKNMGTIWKKPYQLDITGALKNGENDIELRVTNLWVNRLIGDAQPDVKQKTTFTTMPFYRANDPLLPSGLLGPVKILTK